MVFRRTSLHLMDDAIHRALGLTDSEYEDIRKILNRDPNHLELAMFAVMWSEHCSYKSSRVHLKRLPTEAPWVLVGPGENAGVVDVGDGIAAAIRIITPPQLSPTKVQQLGLAAFCATSSRWAHVRLHSWTHCALVHSMTLVVDGLPKASSAASRVMAIQ